MSALYAAYAQNAELDTGYLLREIAKTKPLSVVMAEKIATLRLWAGGRTVSAD